MVVRRASGASLAEDDIMKNAKNLLLILIVATAAIWIGEALLNVDVTGNAQGVVPEAHATHSNCAVSGFTPDTDHGTNDDGSVTGSCSKQGSTAAECGLISDSAFDTTTNTCSYLVETSPPTITKGEEEQNGGATPNDEGERILAELRGIRDDTKVVSGSIVTVFKYILLIATIGAVVVLRTGPARNLKVSLEDGPAVRPANA